MKKKVLDIYDLKILGYIVERMKNAANVAETEMKKEGMSYAFAFGFMQGVTAEYAKEIDKILKEAKTED